MTIFTISSTTVNRQHQEQHRKTNLKEARLAKRDVFIVSTGRHVIFSLVTAKGHKKTPTVFDEARLMETFLMSAHARRYSNQQLALRTICSQIHISLALTDHPLALTGFESFTNE